MKWTTDKPTESKWYWFRPTAKVDAGVEIAHIIYNEKGDLVVEWCGSDGYHEIDYPNAEWKGPIKEKT